MAGKAKRTTTIRIDSETKAALDKIRHTGQSYNGLIQELVASIKRGNRDVHQAGQD